MCVNLRKILIIYLCMRDNKLAPLQLNEIKKNKKSFEIVVIHHQINYKTIICSCFSIKFSCYFFISSATTSKRLKTPDIPLTSLLEVHPFTRSDRSIKASSSCSVKTKKNKFYCNDVSIPRYVKTDWYHLFNYDVWLTKDALNSRVSQDATFSFYSFSINTTDTI